MKCSLLYILYVFRGQFFCGNDSLLRQNLTKFSRVLEPIDRQAILGGMKLKYFGGHEPNAGPNHVINFACQFQVLFAALKR